MELTDVVLHEALGALDSCTGHFVGVYLFASVGERSVYMWS